MNAKDTYRRFCQQNRDLPIFFQDWYLDAVCDEGIWEVALVEKAGQVIAVLPYYLKKKGPFSYLTMPHLTKMMGPYFVPTDRNKANFTKVCKVLIEQLPKVAYYGQTFHYSITNWLPFYWKQYQQTTRYSYVLDVTDLNKVYAGIIADYRNNKIKKAKTLVKIVQDLPLSTFYSVNQLSFDRQGMVVPYSFPFLQRLDKALEKHQAKTIFFAIDDQERVHSVAYLIWDNHCAYYLMAGDDPTLRKSGAGILLTWKAIEFASQYLGVQQFDFQGSMIQAIEKVRRGFGAVQQPYFFIEQYHSLLFKMLMNFKTGLFR